MTESHTAIREEVAKLCQQFPGEYWRAKDHDRAYPGEFVAALTA
ncbi:MAG TPA: acyl-CoA dehydrogenase, partial [Polymorphobacter sp.]|nr:acyl-CoA dehydrogenase [Polymorphobacter sp.]